MTIVLGDILRTSVNFTLADGTEYQNVYHHQRTGVAILTDQQHVDALDAWATAAYGEIAAMVKSDVTEQLSFVDLVEFVAGQWTVVENIGTFTIVFTPIAVAGALPNQISPFVIFKTPRPKTVGRKFLFPLTNANVTAGILDAVALAAVVAYADDVVNNIELVILNLLVPGVPRTGVDDYQEFAVAVVTDLVGTQRRRRPGVGA